MLIGLVLIVTGTYLNMAHMNEVQNISEVGPTESLEKLNLDLQIPQTGDIAKSAVGASQSADNSATRKEPVAPEPPPEETEKKDTLSEQKLEQTDEKREQKGEDKPSENKAKKNSQGLDAKDDSLRKTLEVKDDKSLGDTLHPDAIKKEEKENKEEGDNEKKTQVDQIEKKQAELLEKIEEQQQEQKKILAEQKEILKELKDHKNKQEEDAKRKDLELQGNSAANPHLNSVPVNLQGHADPAMLIQNPAEPVVSHDLNLGILPSNLCWVGSSSRWQCPSPTTRSDSRFDSHSPDPVQLQGPQCLQGDGILPSPGAMPRILSASSVTPLKAPQSNWAVGEGKLFSLRGSAPDMGANRLLSIGHSRIPH
ncbi:chromatin assembly factor 1 subunit A-like [Penaeus monodon]|uniref:chromatin assembly factor 1 subunit A-like n=1 Tax=Penaeus monodon TaxID=6687 RepID=UPI0018A77BE5|nr:chromatin assembly factor 1 subunit A-like [Penaeus monodon]